MEFGLELGERVRYRYRLDAACNGSAVGERERVELLDDGNAAFVDSATNESQGLGDLIGHLKEYLVDEKHRIALMQRILDAREGAGLTSLIALQMYPALRLQYAAGFVAEARAAVVREVDLPDGWTVKWGGQFENLEAASRRLAMLVPLALMRMFVLLFTARIWSSDVNRRDRAGESIEPSVGSEE